MVGKSEPMQRVLTPFPTRRSSDLAFYRTLMWNSRFHSLSRDPFDNSAGFVFPAPEGTSLSYLPHLRSEEHTSELQSHSDLVCRLLLEKKKTYTTHTTHAQTRKCRP